MKNLINATVKFKVGKKPIEFNVEHNLPNIPGLSFNDAVVNWVYRTDDYTAESLSKYINDKDTEHYCRPAKINQNETKD